TCIDALSGIASCASPATLKEGTAQSATGTATDKAGNTASATVSGISVDKTAPSVTYSGNAGTYTIDQQVNITCAASDNLSGVASTTCQNVSVAASALGAGTRTYTAQATDKAGNVGSASATVTVVVNAQG